jgi:hypothetical protein
MRYGYAVLFGTLLAATVARPAGAQKLVRRFAGSAVLLTSGDTLRGPLTLYSDQDMIVLRQADGTLRTFTSWTVKAFAVKGELTRYEYLLPPPTAPASPALDRLERALVATIDTTDVRTFVSYRGRPQLRQRRGTTGAPGFYELLCDGAVRLLRRESLRAQAQQAYLERNRRHELRPLAMPSYLVSTFYLSTANGLTPLRQPRRDLAVLLPRQAPALERYADLNQLNYANPYQLRAIVRYANNLLLAEAP